MDGGFEPPIEVEIKQISGAYNGWAGSAGNDEQFSLKFWPDYLPFTWNHEPLKVAGRQLPPIEIVGL